MKPIGTFFSAHKISLHLAASIPLAFYALDVFAIQALTTPLSDDPTFIDENIPAPSSPETPTAPTAAPTTMPVVPVPPSPSTSHNTPSPTHVVLPESLPKTVEEKEIEISIPALPEKMTPEQLPLSSPTPSTPMTAETKPAPKPVELHAPISAPTTGTAVQETPKKTGKEGSVAGYQSLTDILNWKGSLMYSSDELNVVYGAVKAYESTKTFQGKSTITSANSNVLLSTLESSHTVIAPRFYLNSILYSSPTDWTVWINGRRISYAHTKMQNLTALEVLKVTPYEAQFRWKSALLNDIAPNWQEKLVETDTQEYVAIDSDITVDRDASQITFTLRPNQHFDVQSMYIAEGPFTQAAAEAQNASSTPNNPSSGR